jgi:hypothetical protein
MLQNTLACHSHEVHPAPRHTCPDEWCGKRSAANAPSYRPEVVSLRESDMVFLRQVLVIFQAPQLKEPDRKHDHPCHKQQSARR